MSDRFQQAREIEDAVRAELRCGGRPLKVYSDLHAARELPEYVGAMLTTAIVQNLEDRIVALEQGADSGC